jgi:hypothetical protein
MITIVPATQEHVLAVAEMMQREHREECEGAGMSALEALQGSLDGAALAETALQDGVPIAMWGVNPTSLIGGHARVWMLGTEALHAFPISVCRLARRFVDRMNARYAVLECFTDLRYHTGCAWVEWLGFREASRVITPATIYSVYRRT